MRSQLVIVFVLAAQLTVHRTQCEVILSERQLSAYHKLQCVHDLQTGNRICDCLSQKQAFVLELMSGNFNGLIIRNCHDLLIVKDTFREISHIQYIVIENIGKLVLESYSVYLPNQSTAKLLLKNVAIEELSSFAMGDGLDTIQFINCNIDKLKAFAINVARHSLYSISFENTQIVDVESQALKKNQMTLFRMVNVTVVNALPTRSFYDLIVTSSVSITNCSFAAINTNAFVFRDSSQFIFSNNRVEKIDGQAFRINVNEAVLFERNQIKAIDNSAFIDIGVGDIFKQTSVQKMWFTFQSNTLETMAIPFGLRIPDAFQFRLIDLKVLTPIGCDGALQLRSNQLLGQFSDTIYFRSENSSSAFYSLATLLTSTCATYSPVAITIISISLVLMLVFALGAAVLLYRVAARCHTTREIPVIMPEGKTYRETQIVMQIEHAGLLKTDL